MCVWYHTDFYTGVLFTYLCCTSTHSIWQDHSFEILKIRNLDQPEDNEEVWQVQILLVHPNKYVNKLKW